MIQWNENQIDLDIRLEAFNLKAKTIKILEAKCKLYELKNTLVCYCCSEMMLNFRKMKLDYITFYNSVAFWKFYLCFFGQIPILIFYIQNSKFYQTNKINFRFILIHCTNIILLLITTINNKINWTFYHRCRTSIMKNIIQHVTQHC